MSTFVLQEGMFFKENRLPIKVLLRDPEIPFSLHSHDFYELVIVVSGQGNHLLVNGERPLQEGMAFFIKPGTYHGYGDIENLVLYDVLIGRKALGSALNELTEIQGFSEVFLQPTDEIPLVKLTSHQLTDVFALISAIKEESEHLEHGKASGTMAYAKLLQLIILLCRIHMARKGASIQIDQRLESVIRYMEENLSRSISLEELVEHSNMSASTLNRQFKLCTGWSPVDFHIHRRIAYASTLLLTTDMSIERISEETGFSDANYFSRQFRNHMKMSPRQYKQLWTTPKD